KTWDSRSARSRSWASSPEVAPIVRSRRSSTSAGRRPASTCRTSCASSVRPTGSRPGRSASAPGYPTDRLTDVSAETSVADETVDMTAEGGDPACWLDRVCEVCGAVIENDGHECPCPICEQGSPSDVVRELDRVWVTGPPRAPLPGYVCVVAKRHAVEPFDLPDGERVAFWEACMSVARALAR